MLDRPVSHPAGQELLLEPAGLQQYLYRALAPQSALVIPLFCPPYAVLQAGPSVFALQWRMSEVQDRECHLDDYLLQNILSKLCGADVCRAQVSLAMSYSQYCARGYIGLARVIASFEC